MSLFLEALSAIKDFLCRMAYFPQLLSDDQRGSAISFASVVLLISGAFRKICIAEHPLNARSAIHDRSNVFIRTSILG